MSNVNYSEAVRLIRKSRRAETRGKAMQGCITGLITSALAFLLRGLWLMLAVGILHAHWWPALPTIGYWWAVATVALLSGVFSVVPTAKDKS